MRLFEGTEFDRPPRCERCGELEEECICPSEPPPQIPPGKQTARLSVEKRRKGKQVTVIRGLSADGNDLSDLLKQLKNACGAGGAMKDDVIEIQGRQVEIIRTALKRLGYQVRD